MKNTGFRYIVMSFLLWGLVCFCGRKERVDRLVATTETKTVSDSKKVLDSVRKLPDYKFSVLILDTLKHRYDSVKHKYDSVKFLNDSLRVKLFLAQYKVEKVNFYLKIVDRKPSQAKFLKGWVRRAIE